MEDIKTATRADIVVIQKVNPKSVGNVQRSQT
jgi:hypothetical protein